MKKKQREGQDEVLLTPTAQVPEDKAPEKPCGCKKESSLLAVQLGGA